MAPPKTRAQTRTKPTPLQPAAQHDDERRLWTPTFETALSLLLLPRVASALVNPIADCDETFNYWEPLHYLMYGFGFQTWEYSPMYALRSYLYLLFHWAIAKATSFGLTLGVLGGAGQMLSKIVVFYGVRGALGLLCAYAEGIFYRSCIAHFGRRTARYLLWILLWNAGIFHASTAFLPSTFVMYLIMLFMSAWMEKQHFVAILWGVIAVLCGWPYVGVLFIPFALETLYTRGVVKSVLTGAVIGASVLTLEVGVNFHYYQRLVLPAWNIVQYNVLSGETDSTLYGTEPWTYYVMNLALNFNIVALLALPAVVFMWLLPSHYATSKLQLVSYLSPLYMWLLIMFAQAHKEERFLFPVYPLLCLAAATTLSAVVYRVRTIFQSLNSAAVGRALAKCLVWSVLGGFALLSASRITSNVINYSAPLRVYNHLYEHELPNEARSALHGKTSQPLVNLCISKEWHRFPASFFIPTNATSVRFVKSAFSGQLPKAFEQHANGTSVIPTDMNNQNREEPSRYLSVEQCDYFVDLNLPDQEETKFWEHTQTWILVHSESFLHAEASRSPYRSFYIPFLTSKHVKYTDYAIYKRVKK
uniref:Mannosyltransferase n=1 Tax=Globisporangium ultimum (strain ATCC 200006 / CBS 805.95 / DAOM BR144) TaxID=431595 RepID=K3WCF1_GLOUD